jgi:hypothetical protein
VSLTARAVGLFQRWMREDTDFQPQQFSDAWLDTVIAFQGLAEGSGGGGGREAGATGRSDVLRVDGAPFTVSSLTPLPKVHYLLAICLFAELLVTRGEGLLAGQIVMADLAASMQRGGGGGGGGGSGGVGEALLAGGGGSGGGGGATREDVDE